MEKMDLIVQDLRSGEKCDVMKKQLLALEGVIEVVIDPTVKIAYVKLSDKCICNIDDVVCQMQNLGYSVNTTTV